MDGMLNERMKQLLADPDAMSRVMEMAGKLFASGEGQGEADSGSVRAQPAPAGVPSAASAVASEPNGGVGDSREPWQEASEADRMRLIDAICPFLSPGRREAAQSMLRVLRLLSMAERSGILGSIGRGGREEG